MSKATITIKDTGDHSASVSVVFDPPLNTDADSNLTPAQSLALTMLQAVKAENVEDAG